MPTPEIIAGHHFENGVCTREVHGGGNCERRLLDILPYGQESIGQHFIAHVGALNLSEAREIEKKRASIVKAVCHASN